MLAPAASPLSPARVGMDREEQVGAQARARSRTARPAPGSGRRRASARRGCRPRRTSSSRSALRQAQRQRPSRDSPAPLRAGIVPAVAGVDHHQRARCDPAGPRTLRQPDLGARPRQFEAYDIARARAPEPAASCRSAIERRQQEHAARGRPASSLQRASDIARAALRHSPASAICVAVCNRTMLATRAIRAIAPSLHRQSREFPASSPVAGRPGFSAGFHRLIIPG